MAKKNEPEIIDDDFQSGNTTYALRQARRNKKDEFYTQYADIEKELKNYKQHFKNKVVYCNCDDPKESNFFLYFANNFEHLELKKLICTHFNYGKGKTYKLVIERGKDLNKDGKINRHDVSQEFLFGDKEYPAGDFRSKECIELLKEADIVCTNPPFSLFREYVKQLQDYNKNFIIIGHQNTLTYKEIFKLIKENKMWLGYGFNGGAGYFINRFYEDYATASNHQEGMIRVSGVVWFTNLDIKKRYEMLIPKKYKKYNPDDYPKYENYDAINVDKTELIPIDYDGEMGVPVTFMDKYNPDQFDIIALGIVGSIKFSNNRNMIILDKKTGKPKTKKDKKTGEEKLIYTKNAKGTLYKKFNPNKPITRENNRAFQDVETGEIYSSIFARIIIKRKRKDA